MENSTNKKMSLFKSETFAMGEILANGFFLTFAMVECKLDQQVEPFRRMPSATIRKVFKND